MTCVPRATNKAKIARRVIEVLEFFDGKQREATVMDIVRRYNRPQSSTSELLCSLVELGLLFKDPYSRSYSLTPRAALLGTAGQAQIIRDGSLPKLIDRLIAQTGLSVALIGKVGLNAQIVTWQAGTRCDASALNGLNGGQQIPLHQSVAGLLLLSTISDRTCDGVVRRLNSEASQDQKFSSSDMKARIAACREEGHVVGGSGFNAASQMIGMLLPSTEEGHPLAITILYSDKDHVNLPSLLACLRDAVQHCCGGEINDTPQLEIISSAA